MAKRYKESSTFQNTDPLYRDRFQARKALSITQYPTLKLKYPTAIESKDLIIHTHIWATGDSYSKLANEFYGDPKLWWVIAHFNQIPIEGDLYYGQTIYIAEPLEALLNYYGV